MSFWPSVYKRILNQKKLLEYRRVFPKDCSYAYMYVSSPVKAICAIINFGKKYSIEEWKNEYKGNTEVIKRISSYSESYKYAMEIRSIQPIQPITLSELRTNVSNFVAPQSYILLDNNEELSIYINSRVQKKGETIVNNLDNILPNHICLNYD